MEKPLTKFIPFIIVAITFLVLVYGLSNLLITNNQKITQTTKHAAINELITPTLNPEEEVSQESFNIISGEASDYILTIHKQTPFRHCPNVVDYYNWKMDFYNKNPELRFAKWTNKAMDLMKKDNLYYWSCGVIFIKIYSDQLGKMLFQNSNSALNYSSPLTAPSQIRPISPIVIAPPIYMFAPQQNTTTQYQAVPYQHISVSADTPSGSAQNLLQRLDDDLLNMNAINHANDIMQIKEKFEDNLYNIEHHFPLGK
ncbi:hypothetical protein HGA88_01755 [Candidatus Roizmanbacteria bacterium]|nr:hypothetical protein [Candidatus Roizmanbacteria bacterium]